MSAISNAIRFVCIPNEGSSVLAYAGISEAVGGVDGVSGVSWCRAISLASKETGDFDPHKVFGAVALSDVT